MTAKECREIGGGIGGNPADSAVISCHLEICEEGTLEFNTPGKYNQKVTATLDTSRADCESLNGVLKSNFDATKDCGMALVEPTPEPIKLRMLQLRERVPIA